MSSSLTVVVTLAEPLGALLERYAAIDALGEGRAFVNGHRASDPNQVLELGARIEVYSPRDRVSDVSVLAEREGLVFVDKPAGLSTEPDRRGACEALSTRVAAALGIAPSRVNALTRLDVGVSGVVIFGVEAEARRRLMQLREQGLILRRYVAIAAQTPEPQTGVWDDAIGRRDSGPRRVAGTRGERAQTRFRVVGRAPTSGAAVLALEPMTGRTHQLRVHASAHAAPLFGDATYGGPTRVVLGDGRVVGIGRVLLHAAWVELARAPRVTSPLPTELAEIWQALEGEHDTLDRAIHEPVT